jgi:hypothetical protein
MAGSLVTRPCPRAKALAALARPGEARGQKFVNALQNAPAIDSGASAELKALYFQRVKILISKFFQNHFLATLWNIRTLRAKKFGDRVF